MKRHWSEVHGLKESLNSFSFGNPVKLQTFFRGTEIRYFEVDPPPGKTTVNEVPLVTTLEDVNNIDDGDVGNDEELQNDQRYGPHVSTLRRASSPLPTCRPTEIPSRSSSINLDLETLQYFHHFTTTTSLTLPNVDSQNLRTQYWQTDVVLQALQHQWLMYGLLTISACHLAALANDSAAGRKHRERAAQFMSDFSIGHREATKSGLDGVIATLEENPGTTSVRIMCVLRCAHFASTESPYGWELIPESAAPSQLHVIINNIRKTIAPDSAVLPKDSGNSNKCDQVAISTCSTSNGTLSTLLNRLHALPSLLAKTFGKLRSVAPILATLSAIDALIECCETSFASDDAGAAWQGMAMWTVKISEQFHSMISCHDPVALVVVGHWAAALVQRVEDCGCWFLRGAANKILRDVEDGLADKGHGAQRLVVGLMA
ncbi:MAG: hypothetical protein Q9227_006102 [Pyrenula ochraceoflavens]